MKNLCTTQIRKVYNLRRDPADRWQVPKLSIRVARDKLSSYQSPRAWPYGISSNHGFKPWKLTCWPSSSGIRQQQKNAAHSFRYNGHTWASDEWSQKKSIWESLRHTFPHPQSWRHRLSQGHVTVLKFPQLGNETQDSHNWPFFSSHVTISMSLCFLAKISSHDDRPPATKLSFASILRDFHLTTAVPSDGSHQKWISKYAN